MNRILLFLFLVFAVAANAQVTFEAEVSKEKLGLNERVRVEFKLNKEGDDFKPPSFKGFRVVGGPNQFVSNRYINGKRTFSRSFSFVLSPLEKGTLTIGQAEIEVDGEKYKTSPIQVEVTEAVETPTDADNHTAVAEDGVHIVAEASKPNPYLNEAIVLTYKLYVSFDVDISQQFRYLDRPTFKGFWNQELEAPSNQVYDGKYKGRDYRYIILEKVLLYPQNTGELVIDPITLDIPIDVPSNRRDFFGRRVNTTVNKTVASNKVTINVKELPAKGKPANFSGAVGDFRLSFSANKDSLVAQESFNTTVRVSGKGNMKLFKLPELELSKTMEVYDPERKETISTNAQGMQGLVEATYTIIPQKPGKYPLGPIEFSYFDPSTSSYKTLRSDELQLQVEPSAAIAVTGGERGTDSSKNVLPEVDQFKFISLKTKLNDIKSTPIFLYKTWYWMLLIATIIAVPVLILLGRWKKLSIADTEKNRLREADKLAKRYLGKAKKKQADKEAFYEALELALHNFLKAKLNINTNDISKEQITLLLEEKNVTKEAITELMNLLTSCEMARYAASSVATTQVNFDKAVATLTKLNKQIK